MEIVKNLSVAIATAGFIVLAAAAEATAVSLEFEQTFGNTGGAGQLNLPQGIDVQEGTGNIYVSDSANNRVAVFDSEGNYLDDFGQGQIDESANLEFNETTGQVFVGDVNGNEIDVFEPDGTYVRSFGEFTVGTDRPFEGPAGVAFSPDFEKFYVANYAGDEIYVFDPGTGEQIDVIGESGTGAGQLSGPSALAISQTTGNLYVSEQLNSRIQVLTPQGESLKTFGEPRPRPVDPSIPVPDDLEPGQLSDPVDIALDESNNVYVTDTLNNRIQVFDSEGNFLTLVDEIAAEPSTYFWPIGAQYEDGKLYTSDFFHNRVVVHDVIKQGSTPVPEPSSVLGIVLLGVGAAVGKFMQHRQQKQAIEN